MGDYFYLGCLCQSSGVLPRCKHGIHNAVKNKPVIEQKAWERGWPGKFARAGGDATGEETCTQRPWEGFYSTRVM